MDIGSLYNVLIGAMTKQTNASTSISRNISSNVSFGDILAAVSNKDTVSAQDMFSVAFQDYYVNVKSGDCSVPLSTWERKDFPAWKFFQEDTGADCLNTWKPKRTQPTGAESYIQSELSKIGYGQMAVIIPDELREKMEAGPQYAWEIAEKVQKYKEDYDRKDNALAATYGYNSSLHQMSKSYCFKLDENGDVKICWVTSGGLDSQKSSEVNGTNVSKRQNNQQTQQIQRRFATTSGRRNSSIQTMPIDALSLLATNTDYLNTASYLGSSYAYNDILKNL
ncbi:MAG: hypothetical protein J1F42_05965 [Lachnospiraceae bacterium]|nr:hypothetical protein [Lachnospiraceae bacterium]